MTSVDLSQSESEFDEDEVDTPPCASSRVTTNWSKTLTDVPKLPFTGPAPGSVHSLSPDDREIDFFQIFFTDQMIQVGAYGIEKYIH